MPRRALLLRAAATLRAWRTREKLSVDAAASDLQIAQQVWTTWESGARRPCLANALLLEARTDGAVPFELWDYAPGLMTTMRAVVAKRAAREAA
jgi:transcriptional regulator with XRE-family HTH domain